MVKKFRIKSSKNKILEKKALIKNFSNIDKKNSALFFVDSSNQNLCSNMLNSKKINVDNFLDFLKKEKIKS
jgi:hypothetical protein